MPHEGLASILKRAAVGAVLGVLHPKDADRAAEVVEGDLLQRGADWLRATTGIDIEIERKDGGE